VVIGPDRPMRRVVDVVVAAGSLVVLSPVLGVVAVLVRRDSPGPALFRQKRIGRGEVPFEILKFRTMVDGADRLGPAVSGNTDARVTRLGAILRRTKLDELPQLVNVLKGDMNIVGPRPERPSIFMQLRKEIDSYHLRQRAKPGITGWAQINQNYDTSIDDVRRKVEYDLAYIERRSVVEDMRIMAKTLPVMIFRKGAH
jgi:lipopolysaccharide/colanic/teichoic acid biosynthesis glycosyltransferase